MLPSISTDQNHANCPVPLHKAVEERWVEHLAYVPKFEGSNLVSAGTGEGGG